MSEDLIGQLLGGRYRIVAAIGAGGMGGVYEAVQEDLGRRVAVKVIATSLAEEPIYIERFRREALASAQLGHPNIVQVTDFQHEPGQAPFLVMELLEGEPLQRRLQRGRLTPAESVDITQQILAGLVAAHAQGIVHRDLKPANVFLVPLSPGHVLVKLVDFGIAKLTDSSTFARLTQTGLMIGTPRYAAPEQIRDSSTVDARTDLYSAGVLLFCMLSGRLPFLSSGAQLMMDVEGLPAPDLRRFVPTLDPGLAAVVARAMQKRPEHRFASAEEMSEALTPFLDGGTPVAGTPIAGTVAMQAGLTPSHLPSTPAASYTPTPIPHAPATHAPATHAPATHAPPTYAPATHAPPTYAPATHAPAAPTYIPTHAPNLPPRRAHLAVPEMPSQRGTIALTALSVVLMALIAAGAVGATWFVMSKRREASTAPVHPQLPVPESCFAWEREACQCANSRARAEYCPMAHATILALRDGEASADCPALLSAMRQACSIPD